MRRLLPLIALAALLACLLLDRVAPGSAPARDDTPGASAGVSPRIAGPAGGIDPTSRRVAPGERRRPAAASGVAAPDPSPRPTDSSVPAPVPIRQAGAPSGESPKTVASMQDTVAAASERAWDWTRLDFDRLRKAPGPLPPEELMTASVYLYSCVGEPTEELAYLRRVDELRRRHERRPRRFSAEWLERSLAEADASYARCGGLGDLDLIAESYGLLELAADLGHAPAQVLFLQAAADLLAGELAGRPPWLFANPGYAERFRQRAVAYTRALLDRGEAAGALAWGFLHHFGKITPPDGATARAFYLLAACLDAGSTEVARRLDLLEPRLTDQELDDSEALAAALSERWCTTTGRDGS